MPPKMTAPASEDSTTKIWEMPCKGAFNTTSIIPVVSTTAAVAEAASTTGSEDDDADDDGSKGRLRSNMLNVTILNANVNCGTDPKAGFKAAATNGVAADPTTVVAIPLAAALKDNDMTAAVVGNGLTKTAAAHPTKQPL